MKLHSMISCHSGTNPCCRGSSSFQYNDFSLTSIIFLLLLLSTSTIHSVRAQSTRPSGSQDDPYYNKFGPSMGVIIIILISALFFMGFFFINIRHHSSTASAARNLPADAATQRQRSRRDTPSFGGGVGEGSDRGGGQLNRVNANRSEIPWSRRGGGEGSSRSTGTAARDSDSETSNIRPDGRSRGRSDRDASTSNQSRSTGNAAKDSGSKISSSASTTGHRKAK